MKKNLTMKDPLLLKNKRVTVMGLGLFGGGVGAVKWLHKSGAKITVTDLRKPFELRESIKELSGLKNIRYHLNGHRTRDFTESDLIIANPAVPSDSPYLKLAEKKGVPIETEINLFFRLCPAPIIGITGSNGKTTTANLIYEIIKNAWRTVWLGGNIGRESLLEKSGQIDGKDIAVMELSSFQLDALKETGLSPRISVVTNITPNHLDRHLSIANYINAKKSILRYQGKSDYAVLNLDDREVRKWEQETLGRVLYFSARPHEYDGAFIKQNRFYVSFNGVKTPVCGITETKLPGRFNLENILAALAATVALNTPKNAAARAIRGFPGVEHRLELAGKINGVKYYNDSIATNPASTIGAIKAVPGNLHIILGGYDKKISFNSLARIISENHCRIKSLILIGSTSGAIYAALLKHAGSRLQKNTAVLLVGSKARTGQSEKNKPALPDFYRAVRLARLMAKAGDSVLLSPACASFDMFRNFAERGTLFKEIISGFACPPPAPPSRGNQPG